MRRNILTAAILVVSVIAAACASSSKSPKDSGLGIRTIECTVVERQQKGPGSSGTSRSYSSTGEYYIVFEAKEGDATARYTFEVNRTQWFRYPEGSHVRITLNNNILTDVRSID